MAGMSISHGRGAKRMPVRKSGLVTKTGQNQLLGLRLRRTVYQKCNSMTELLGVSGRIEVRVRLQSFPLVHEVPNLPHQRLMTVDDRLSGYPVVVEAGRGH